MLNGFKYMKKQDYAAFIIGGYLGQKIVRTILRKVLPR